MLRTFVLGCFLGAITLAGAQHASKFSMYRTVEAYEARPGILVLPRYTNTGQVCEVAIQRLHYHDEEVDLFSNLPEPQLLQVIDELAPASERGPKDDTLGNLVTGSGRSVIIHRYYANVTITLYIMSGSSEGDGNLVALIQWNNRVCK